MQRFICRTGFDSLVASEYFCPRFLKNQNPNLTPLRRPTERPGLLLTIVRKTIVNNDSPLLSADEQLYSVDASFIGPILQEDIFNPLGRFSERRQCRQEVTITTHPLLDIVRLNFIVKRVVTVPVNFRWTTPLKLRPLLNTLSHL